MNDTFIIPFAYKEKVDTNKRFLAKDILIKALSSERIQELIKNHSFPVLDAYKTNSMDIIINSKDCICTLLSFDFENMTAKCKFKDPSKYNPNMEMFFSYLCEVENKNNICMLTEPLTVKYAVVSSTIISAYK